MPSSFASHVMRYCDRCSPRCRGHRSPRPPAPPGGEFTMPKPKRNTPPLAPSIRRMNYRAQNGRLELTPRQERQVRRMQARHHHD